MLFTAPFAVLLTALSVSAAPAKVPSLPDFKTGVGAIFSKKTPSIPNLPTGCDVSKAKMNLAPIANGLAAPTGVPKYVALGVGVQNYTCTAGKYVSAGAAAQLLDVSCLVGTPLFDMTNQVYDIIPKTTTAKEVFAIPPQSAPGLLLGQHYFVPGATAGTITPRFDFSASSQAGNKNAFVDLKKVLGVAAPNPADVDWLNLASIGGGLASAVYRIDTKAGQPPSSCVADPAKPILSVPYVAKYWFIA